MIRNISIIALLLVGSVGCDQVSKGAATHWLHGEPTRSYLGDTFRLLYTENTGAFLGMGAEWPGFIRWGVFTLFSSLAVGAALIWAIRHVHQTHSFRPYGPTLGALLVAAGGIGNLIDRVMRDGAVIDFMNMGLGSLRTGIFNVADVQIMVGLALWMLWKGPAPETHTATGAGDAER